MKYRWLNNKRNAEIIIFFNGWGMDETVVNHLQPENYDVLMFYDYNELNINFDFNILADYSQIYLVAWSMGVMIATLFDIDYAKKIAINGTLYPINDKFGIPTKIYELTVNGLTPKGVNKFIKNMYSNEYNLPQISRTFEEQKSELAAIKKYISNNEFKYDKVLISDNDKIIPTKNQIAFWGIEPNLHAGHAPFLLFNKWSELL